MYGFQKDMITEDLSKALQDSARQSGFNNGFGIGAIVATATFMGFIGLAFILATL